MLSLQMLVIKTVEVTTWHGLVMMAQFLLMHFSLTIWLSHFWPKIIPSSMKSKLTFPRYPNPITSVTIPNLRHPNQDIRRINDAHLSTLC